MLILDVTQMSLTVSLMTTYLCLPVNNGEAVFFQCTAAPVFVEKPPPRYFVTISPVSCLFRLLATNLLAQAICKNGNYFAWQGISLELNNGCSCEIWQQGLTFGSLCLLPRLIYVSRLCSVPPSGRGVAGNPNLR